jgi:hypothetical protein
MPTRRATGMRQKIEKSYPRIVRFGDYMGVNGTRSDRLRVKHQAPQAGWYRAVPGFWEC